MPAARQIVELVNEVAVIVAGIEMENHLDGGDPDHDHGQAGR
jgi:uncharacterized protein YkvS